MKKLLLLIVLAFLVLVAAAAYVNRSKLSNNPTPGLPEATSTTEIENPAISLNPSSIEQGDPVLVTIEGADIKQIMSLTWQGAALPLLIYEGRPAALVGIDLKKPTGGYPLILRLADGSEVKKDLIVAKREIATAPLGIPAKLGGNTPEAAQNLITTLANENATLSSVRSIDEQLWHEPFGLPIKGEIVITDPYGYTRETVNTSISHKGTDFRAAVGTPVYAMNSGKVALTREFVEYGKTIIIDHGLGLETLYMHLSEIDVVTGQMVEKGQLIGKSGMTGYAEFPHLHISVKIGGISIDPAKFLELFNINLPEAN